MTIIIIQCIVIIIGLAVHPWLNLESFYAIPTSEMIFFFVFPG